MLSKRDRERFYLDHSQDWLGITAYGSWEPTVPAGMVGVLATMGGARNAGVEVRAFLVPLAEYKARGEAFIIDPARHAAWDRTKPAERRPVPTDLDAPTWATQTPCGCVNHLGGGIVYCPTHAAAPDMLGPLRWLVGAFDRGALTIRPDASVGEIASARAIIARVDGGA